MRKLVILLIALSFVLAGCADSSENLAETVPEDFHFSFTWNTYGVSSYDSKTGKLIKTTDATEPEKYITTLYFSNEELLEIYNGFLGLDITSYPDHYDPFNDPDSGIRRESKPSQTIILSFNTDSVNKTVECKNVLFFGNEGYDDRSNAFLDLCERLCELITSSDEWKALPQYEYLYE